MIKVRQMIQTMRLKGANGKPKPFSIIFATANQQRSDKSSRFIELTRAILLTKQRQTDRYLLIQPLGTKDAITLHLDLIIYFNNQEVV